MFPYKIFKFIFALGQSLTIKTKEILKNIFEKYDEEKIPKFILDTELEFENVSPQIQLFSLLFNYFLERIILEVNDFVKTIFRNVFLI